MENKRLKIAFLNKYQSKASRGAETYVAEISKRLQKIFDVDVISEIDYLKIFRKKYDVIIPTNGREQVLIIKLICMLRNTKMVVSGQSGLGADDKLNLIAFPNVFIALTKEQEEWANKFNKRVKTVVIPNGVDLEKFNSKVKSIKIDLPKPIILSVGALVEEKRQDLIIKAVAKTKASLLIVGRGDREKELQKLGNELLPGRFLIKSFDYEDMPKIYTACDLFTYPTVPWESFGIVMVEAMASGLPVVANDDPIRRKIVGNAGLFVDPNNYEEYANKINEALKKKWGNVPRKQAEKFSWDLVADKYSQVIRQIVTS